MTPRILIGCERSGIIRDEFRRLGYDAWSVDLEECEGDQRHHFKADLFDVIDPHPVNRAYDRLHKRWWDALIVHPECRYTSVSGFHWNYRKPGRATKTEEAIKFALKCWRLREYVPHVCLEQPVTILSRQEYLGEKSQSIQPYDFGEDASKRTLFWLHNLSPLKATKRVHGRWVKRPADGRLVERWSNQTDSGQNRLGPSETRSMDRARTYRGIAQAMAEQWGREIMEEHGRRRSVMETAG